MTINKGEVRQIGIEVISQVKQDFIIENAEYRIISRDGTLVEKGVASVEGHKILTLISGSSAGVFYCEFTYRIGPEILKAKVLVEVK
jgi:hypothetical protein